MELEEAIRRKRALRDDIREINAVLYENRMKLSFNEWDELVEKKKTYPMCRVHIL
jgi:hypothetical protein